jgi:5-methylcytosine-specific restriction enzyme subunit McrC
MKDIKVIYEYSRVEDKRVKDSILSNSVLEKYFKRDFKGLKTQQYCGVLNIENQDIYLLPKIVEGSKKNLDIFLYMLMYSHDIKLKNEDIASCKNENNSILEVFIQFFAQRLFKEFKSGVYKEYITERNNLTTLRGKYLINENLKYNFVKNRIYCEYDEFSENNKLNQFFLYALKTLMQYTKNKKLLKQCELVLDEVEYIVFDIKNTNIDFNRLSKRYKDSFEFAILLLSKSIPLFSQDKKSFVFLFDMNDLFEEFIGRIYKDIDSSATTQTQKSFGNLQLIPDIMTSSMIIDTKYKKVKNISDLSVPDKYQMFVYGTNFKVQDTMLLYPKYKDVVDEDLELGIGDKMIRLKMRSIDLDFDGGYDEFIYEIRARLKLI